MHLAGQDRFTRIVRSRRGEHGYAMAALLVALGVMSVMITMVMPVWKQASQREKEAELIFRGQQYARAIGLFQRRAGPGALPPSVDLLIQQRFLRKKYKDPITGDDFQLLVGTAAPAGGGGPGSAGPPATGGGAGMGGAAAPPGQTPGSTGLGVTGAAGGFQGVVSKSKAKSIRLYNGRNAYNEWTFVFAAQEQAAGGGGGRGGPGGVADPTAGIGRRGGGRPGAGGVGQPPQGGGPSSSRPRPPEPPRR